MSRLIIGAVLALACLFVVTPTHAQRYCLQGDRWGYPGNCSFSTHDQCRASASGTRAHCGVNPRYQQHRRAQPR